MIRLSCFAFSLLGKNCKVHVKIFCYYILKWYTLIFTNFNFQLVINLSNWKSEQIFISDLVVLGISKEVSTYKAISCLFFRLECKNTP